jgi:hypothetical protein
VTWSDFFRVADGEEKGEEVTFAAPPLVRCGGIDKLCWRRDGHFLGIVLIELVRVFESWVGCGLCFMIFTLRL